MRISDLHEKKDDKKKGTYAAASLSSVTKKKITAWFKANNIDKPVDVDEMHCTLLYSRKYLDDYLPAGKYDDKLLGKDGKFEIWPNRDKTENVLVLSLKSPDLAKRHKHLMDKHGATYDFPDYKPHVSFSYDFGDRKVDDLDPIDFDIEFDTEYSEDLDLD